MVKATDLNLFEKIPNLVITFCSSFSLISYKSVETRKKDVIVQKNIKYLFHSTTKMITVKRKKLDNFFCYKNVVNTTKITHF